MKKLSVVLGIIIALMCEMSILFIKFIPKPLPLTTDVYALEKVIYRPMITINNLINKYKRILVKNDLNEIDLEYLTVIDDTYYVGLYQDIILFITPFEYNSLNNDLVYQTGIIINEETDNFELAIRYYQYLIEANNEFIFNANELVERVIDGDLVKENNGLILASIVNDGEINLFIERKYNSQLYFFANSQLYFFVS